MPPAPAPWPNSVADALAREEPAEFAHVLLEHKLESDVVQPPVALKLIKARAVRRLAGWARRDGGWRGDGSGSDGNGGGGSGGGSAVGGVAPGIGE